MSQNLHFRTDFKIFETPPQDASYTFLVPFRFSYYTTGDKVFVASHNNGEYANCELLKDGRLKIAFENHGLAPGRVMCIREFFLTDEDYSDGICNVRITTATDIYLTMNGGDVGDISVQLPPFYQKGDKGDPFTWSDMTPEQREYFIEQVGADVVATNNAIIEAEAARASSWENLSSAINNAIGSAYAASSDANKAAANARGAANEVGEKGDYAKEQGDYAKSQGDYAKERGNEAYSQSLNAYSAARQARDEANWAKDKGDLAKQQGNIAEDKGNEAKTKGDEAKTKGDIAEQQGISAAEAAAATNKVREDFFDWFTPLEEKEYSRQEHETIRESNERGRIQLENNRIEFERLRSEAEIKRQEETSAAIERVNTAVTNANEAEIIRGTQETQRKKQEDGRVVAENAREEAESKRQKDTSAAILNAHQAADSANEAAESANEARESIQNDLAKKADIDKFYPKMTAGFAQDIVGDGSATPEEFSFRPTAGEERNVANTTYYEGERNGVARIKVLKGNSVVLNQQIRNMIGTTARGFWRARQGLSFAEEDNGVITLKYNPDVVLFNNQIVQNVNIKNNEKYYCSYGFESYNKDQYQRRVVIGFTSSWSNRGSFNDVLTGKGLGEIGFVEGIGTLNNPSNDVNNLCIWFAHPETPVEELNTTPLKIKNLIFINLTKMFGAGNEPTTVEEFYQRLPVGINLNAYNEGTIIDGNYGGIKTVGFNAFNGTYAKVCAGCPYYLGGNYTSLGFTTEEGGTLEAITLPTSTESVGTTPSDRLYTPSQSGYIYAEGTNININLSWDTEYGYLNGTYQPYKPFERDLSWIGRIKDSNGNLVFPNGMRSAGSARDEIRFNSTTQKWEAVQNVGVMDLGSLQWQRLDNGSFNTKSEVPIADLKKPSSYYYVNSICSNYIVVSEGEFTDTTTCLAVFTSGRLWLKDGKYTDVDSFQAALQGVMLNYELAEPIITEIEDDINMDFDVSDYGTEELIVAEGAQSAPLLADITYAPNALSTIKQVPDILKRLKALESALAQQTTNAEPSNIEE